MRIAPVLVLAVLLAACGGGGGDDTVACTPAEIPEDAVPCDEPALWPNQLRSASLPIELHYPCEYDAARAAEVLAMLEGFWAIETGDMRFAAPLEGADCGTDGAVDVFIWPDSDAAYAEAISDDPSTPQNDWHTIMAIDPEGAYGGELLAATLAHELNHMCQAADDWDEPIALLEATATYVEAQLAPGSNVHALVLPDFQARPAWSVDHDDGYDTWFMYGAALYLDILRAARLDDHVAAIGDLWRAMRDTGPDNEPDWADAVRAAVGPATLEDTIVDLAVWRWYTGPNADGFHLDGATDLPPPALAGTATPATTTLALGPIDPLGMAYVTVSGGTATVAVTGLPADLAVRMLALPGAAADHDELAVADATATLDASSGPRTLAIVVVPTAVYDPESRPAAADLALSFTWN